MDAIEDHQIEVIVPECFSKELCFGKNKARQLLENRQSAILDLLSQPPIITRSDGSTIFLLSSDQYQSHPHSRYLHIPTTGLQHPSIIPFDSQVKWNGDLSTDPPNSIVTTWNNTINYSIGDEENNIAGLRLPQIGAVHSVLGYWTTGNQQPITVVMPTGTGKTETMIVLLVAQRISKLLIIVPSDVLRNQISRKFEAFGILQRDGIIPRTAKKPVVGQIKQSFKSIGDARTFSAACNVMVTTPSALFASSMDVANELLNCCTHLFIDEAHHVEAATWKKIRDNFPDKPVVQFTATPFREDGKRLAGQIIYKFSLKEAQRQKYFSTINYLPIINLDDPDKAIARSAIDVLRRDISSGFDHILMARVKKISRAEEILGIYREFASDLSPVMLHSTMPEQARKFALASIKNRSSRIIVCVDMLGEGFDLPNLKIAALHDPHKSIGITLQFIGRFARVSDSSIGNATIVTAKPEGKFDINLRNLYSEEPDWNLILRDLSESSINRQHEANDFDNSFGSLPEGVSIKNIELKMSSVIYRTHCEEWKPQAIYECFPHDDFYTNPIAVNESDKVAWFVVKIHTPVVWGNVASIYDTRYDFYAIYWDRENNLLYLNGSNNDSYYSELAQAICGVDAELITGDVIFRAMAGINRLVPTNVGLLDVRNRSRRFSLHVGADVIEGFPIAEAQTKTKTNIFAYGFENGIRVSIGGSLKGRVWSYRIASIMKDWVRWCDHIGSKVIDDNIIIDEVMKGFIRPQTIESRPPFVALGLEWPWEIIVNTSDETRLRFNNREYPLIDVDLVVLDHLNIGNIRFALKSPEWTANYEISFSAGRMNYIAQAEEIIVVSRRSEFPLSEYLYKHGLIILLEKDATIVSPGLLLKPNRDIPPIDTKNIISIDWTGINFRKESWGTNREQDSVQARAVEYIRNLAAWDLLLDDDGSGEIADIVAIRVEGENLIVSLTHCKYSSEITSGSRIEDLYEVCGQAQKSIAWRKNTDKFFSQLLRRERNRRKKYNRSGIIIGSPEGIISLADQSQYLKPIFNIYIAQPGVSAKQLSPQMLELLGATDIYLREVANADFKVLCDQ